MKEVAEIGGGCKILSLKIAIKPEHEVSISINQYSISMGKDNVMFQRHYLNENFSKDHSYIAGGHTHHNNNWEIMEWAYGGSIIVKLHFPDGNCKEFELKDRTKAILVAPGVYHEVIIPPKSGLLVVASEDYDHASETTEKPCNCK